MNLSLGLSPGSALLAHPAVRAPSSMRTGFARTYLDLQEHK
jgi:hypothetical protein